MDDAPSFEMFLADMLRGIAADGGGARELEMIARMLDGTHLNWRLEAIQRAGHPLTDFDRDMAIVRLIGEHRDRIGRGGVARGIEVAVQQYGLGEDRIKQIWRRLRLALEPGNEKIVPLFERASRRKRLK